MAHEEVTVSEVVELRDVCVEAAKRGGAVLRERWSMKRTIELKGGIDLVTDADRASEAAILEVLRSRLPGVAILAEESGASGDASGALRFFVDPLDGTTNYAHGVAHFAVNIAVVDRSGLAAGATGGASCTFSSMGLAPASPLTRKAQASRTSR